MDAEKFSIFSKHKSAISEMYQNQQHCRKLPAGCKFFLWMRVFLRDFASTRIFQLNQDKKVIKSRDFQFFIFRDP